MPHGQLDLGHASAGRAQHLAQLGLGPHGAEHSGACADHGDGFVAEGVGCERPRCPVDRVLEHAGDRRVVLGGGEQHGIGVGDRLPETGDGRRAVPDVVVLVVGRDRLEAVEDHELRPVLLDDSPAAPSSSVLCESRRRLPLMPSTRITTPSPAAGRR